MTLEDIRLLEEDHSPDGWPAIRMRDISALLDEIDRLNKALKYEQHRAERIGTHADGCWSWGPAAYRLKDPEIKGKHHYFDACELNPEVANKLESLYTKPHDHYKRILWDVCKNYGTAGECVFAGFKAALDKEAKWQ